MRALIVTNMWPSPEAPALGSFVRDQVDALHRVGGDALDLEVFAFPPGGYAGAARALRRLDRSRPFDVVHAHFGLSAWPALAAPAHARAVTLHGTDLRHPRTRVLTRIVLPRLDLVATVSEDLAGELSAAQRRRAVILPCGVATDRFRPIDRARGAGRARPRSGSGATCCSRPTPRARASGTTCRRGRGATGADAARAARRPARARTAVRQLGRRRRHALRARGVRARGARGARVRRPGPRTADGHPRRSSGRNRGDAVRALRPRRAGRMR